MNVRYDARDILISKSALFIKNIHSTGEVGGIENK